MRYDLKRTFGGPTTKDAERSDFQLRREVRPPGTLGGPTSTAVRRSDLWEHLIAQTSRGGP